jgi:hypothetical protein
MVSYYDDQINGDEMARSLTCMEEIKNACTVIVEKPEGTRSPG